MKNPWQEFSSLLERERQAIINGDLEGLLECVKQKEALLQSPAFKRAPLTPELRQKISAQVKRNQMLLKAGLAFIEEAYKFLSQNMAPKAGYSPRGTARKASSAGLINFQA